MPFWVRADSLPRSKRLSAVVADILQRELRSASEGSDVPRLAVMTLTARGAPRTSNLQGVLEFLDCGREWIVRGFEELTTEYMHGRWGKLTKQDMIE